MNICKAISVPKWMSKVYHNIINKDVEQKAQKIRDFEALTNKQQDEQQFKKFQEIISYAKLHVPYYKKTLSKIKVKTKKDIEKIPILTKEEINKNNELLISDKVKDQKLKQLFTSGSTGIPLKVYQNKEAVQGKKAQLLLNYEWMGYEVGDKVAVLWGSSQYFKLKRWKDWVENFFMNTRELRTFEITEKKMLAFAKFLSKFKPDYIESYVSSIILLAEVAKKHNIIIRPKAIQASSEMLPQKQRDFIENVFKTKVYDKYGANEVGPIGHECKVHRGMHVNRYSVYVEIQKNNEVLITSMSNKAMPFIRYSIGDLAKWDYSTEKCGIKGKKISALKGRIVDMIRTTKNHYVDSYFFVSLMDKVNNVKKFKVIQRKDTSLDIYITTEKNADKSHIEERIKHKISTLDDKLITKIHFVSTIPKDKGEKLRFIITEIKK